MTEIQLFLFSQFPYVNVLPMSTDIVELGPAPTWCDMCNEDTYSVVMSDPRHRMCEHAEECSGCMNNSHETDNCSWCFTCDQCGDCCPCAFCQACEEMVDTSDYHNLCDRCDNCCECMTCESCSVQVTMQDLNHGNRYMCGECDNCDNCCTCSDEDENGCSCEDCQGRSSSRTNEENIPTDGHYIGVEIEFMGSSVRVQEALRVAGLHNWKVVYDGSVGSNGGELVSPPMNWDTTQANEDLHKACEILQRMDCTTSERCGIHVHVDARDLTPTQAAQVGVWGHDYEDQLYRLASSGWGHIRPEGLRNYCKPITDETCEALLKVTDESSFARAWYQSSYMARSDHYNATRYHCVNLHSWAYRGTVEFRVFNSSLSARRISTYISLCVGVVSSTRDGKATRPTKAYKLGGMASGDVQPCEALSELKRSVFAYIGADVVRGLDHVWSDSRPQSLR